MSTKSSYTAASTLPAKVLQNARLCASIREGYIPPMHPQLIPTNKCNLKCGFCSCTNRDKSKELGLSEASAIMGALACAGADAVTITGGGEPMVYRDINSLIWLIRQEGMKIGLVTNGVELKRLDPKAAICLTWVRVSASDEACRLNAWRDVALRHTNIDWAISYVLTAKPNPMNLAMHVKFANDHNLTHVRVVSDLIDLDHAAVMAEQKSMLAGMGIDDSKVIWQGRKDHKRGAKRCWISLLKPLIGADGNLYPCCGVQYAQEQMALDLPESMSMGPAFDVEAVWNRNDQVPFDGSRCTRCYYGEYNEVIEALRGENSHAQFV